jgi:hypothetical protein
MAGGHSTIAGRLAGAFRNIGRDRIADDIIKTMGPSGMTYVKLTHLMLYLLSAL